MIDELGLAPHPEGGWFRRTWTHPDTDGSGRALASSILFLLRAGERSHWHRVDAVELWQFVSGDPLELTVWSPSGAQIHVLGDPATGAAAQVAVPAHAWQRAAPTGDRTLVTCVVVPAFVESGFELAPEGWSPG